MSLAGGVYLLGKKNKNILTHCYGENVIFVLNCHFSVFFSLSIISAAFTRLTTFFSCSDFFCRCIHRCYCAPSMRMHLNGKRKCFGYACKQKSRWFFCIFFSIKHVLFRFSWDLTKRKYFFVAEIWNKKAKKVLLMVKIQNKWKKKRKITNVPELDFYNEFMQFKWTTEQRLRFVEYKKAIHL